MNRKNILTLVVVAVAVLLGVWNHLRVRYVEREYPNGVVYRGEWCRGYKNGRGEKIYPDGRRYVGEFVNDTIHGRGRLYGSDGSVFRGVWVKGLREGAGVLCMVDSSSIYEGVWQRDTLFSGVWITDSSRYEGALQGMIPHGTGVMTLSDGDSYAGRWCHGVRHGVGRLTNSEKGSFEFGYWANDSLRRPEGARYKFGDKVYGIDVSHHQRQISWGDLALYCNHKGEIYRTQTNEDTTYLQPVWFAMIKSTEGATYQDPRYKQNVEAARKFGLVKGSYHYMRLTSTIPDQVNNYIRNTQWSEGDFPPILDVEVDSAEVATVGKERFKDLVLLWLESVEAYYGVRPILYTYVMYQREYLDDKRFNKYDIWLARYSDERPRRQKWMIWQFTDRGRASGIAPRVDLNVYDGNIDKMRKYLSDL